MQPLAREHRVETSPPPAPPESLIVTRCARKLNKRDNADGSNISNRDRPQIPYIRNREGSFEIENEILLKFILLFFFSFFFSNERNTFDFPGKGSDAYIARVK